MAAWQAIRPLVPSACLIEDAPADAEVYDTVSSTRTALSKAVRGEDDRIVVIVGPTATHECKATMEFARKLSAMAESLKAELIVVMRVGMAPHGDWAGMVSRRSLPPAMCCEPPMISSRCRRPTQIFDPDMNGSIKINKGLLQARQLLTAASSLLLPSARAYTRPVSWPLRVVTPP